MAGCHTGPVPTPAACSCKVNNRLRAPPLAGVRRRERHASRMSLTICTHHSVVTHTQVSAPAFQAAWCAGALHASTLPANRPDLGKCVASRSSMRSCLQNIAGAFRLVKSIKWGCSGTVIAFQSLKPNTLRIEQTIWDQPGCADVNF
jgi:hypothetical protein